jgi:hypothetical protein
MGGATPSNGSSLPPSTGRTCHGFTRRRSPLRATAPSHHHRHSSSLHILLRSSSSTTPHDDAALPSMSVESRYVRARACWQSRDPARQGRVLGAMRDGWVFGWVPMLTRDTTCHSEPSGARVTADMMSAAGPEQRAEAGRLERAGPMRMWQRRELRWERTHFTNWICLCVPPGWNSLLTNHSLYFSLFPHFRDRSIPIARQVLPVRGGNEYPYMQHEIQRGPGE